MLRHLFLFCFLSLNFSNFVFSSALEDQAKKDVILLNEKIEKILIKVVCKRSKTFKGLLLVPKAEKKKAARFAIEKINTLCELYEQVIEKSQYYLIETQEQAIIELEEWREVKGEINEHFRSSPTIELTPSTSGIFNDDPSTKVEEPEEEAVVVYPIATKAQKPRKKLTCGARFSHLLAKVFVEPFEVDSYSYDRAYVEALCQSSSEFFEGPFF